MHDGNGIRIICCKQPRISVCVGLRIEMVVGHGKSRAIVDRGVKKEAVDHCYYDDLRASTAAGKALTLAWDCEVTEDDDDLTLLHWSKSPKHTSPSTTVSLLSLYSHN